MTVSLVNATLPCVAVRRDGACLCVDAAEAWPDERDQACASVTEDRSRSGPAGAKW